MIEQFEKMYHIRDAKRRELQYKKDREKENNNNSGGNGEHGSSGYRPVFQGRNSSVQSVL
ncbi:MAG: hypothetical protein R2685_07820 [Candidatus Nitrosocosmicus sp.]|nr:hypothetical protein [Candidatus Nitrosocosmicus sp.]